MKRVLLIGLVVSVVAGTGLYLFAQRRPSLSLLDEDCPDGTRYPLVVSVSAPSSGGVTHEDIGLIDPTGEFRRVTSDGASFDPSFSPDGSQVAFTKGYGGLSDSTGWYGQGVSVVDIDGGRHRALTEGPVDTQPAWSPDGDVIAFVREEGRLMVVPASEGEAELVYEDSKGVRSPQWSADGDRIAFLAGDSQGAVKTVGEDGADVKMISSHLGDADLLAWSPDGETFAYGGVTTLTVEEPNPREFVDDVAVVGDFGPEGDYLMYLDQPDLPDEDTRLAAKPIAGGDTVFVKALLSPRTALTGHVDWLDCP